MHFHILGTGAVGCHVASLLRMTNHKVTLILRSQKALQDFKAQNQSIALTMKGKSMSIGGFDSMVIPSTPSQGPSIECLVVSTKAQSVIEAVLPLKNRLTKDSTVLLLQNGMGVVEELMDTVWRGQESPRILVGVNRHATQRTSAFNIINHSGWNDPEGLVIGERCQSGEISHDSPVLKSLSEVKDLSLSIVPWKDLQYRMAKKLIINASINPVAAILNFTNGAMIDNNPYSLKMMRDLCNEAYSVLEKMLPGETAESAFEAVVGILHITKTNRCSMLQDISANRQTEVDYINGYLCRIGKEQGKILRVNQTMVDLIHAKEKGSK
ncbi:ketopantoate reductase PanE/ApbA C terminal-domain-containing protein [Phycomyces nitens]|nr:ketopantoate reductase PanE/ApbA C terminal-domain-containing protein [Phycomyces nitens]